MKTIVVKRSKWLRGNNGESCLFHPELGMCCLGFLAEQCGVGRKTLKYTGQPGDLATPSRNKCLITKALRHKEARENTLTGGHYYWKEFVEVNDNPRLSDSKREKALQEIATAHGFRFKFVD